MSEAPERIWWNVAPLPYSYTSTVQFAGGVEYVRADRIEELEAKLEKAMRYFDEAMYFIDLDEEDILKGAGVYRIAKAYAELGAVIPAEWDAAIKHVAELKGQDDGQAPHAG